MVELAPARTMVATAAAAAPGQSDSNFAAPSSGLTISVNNTGAIEATKAHPTRGLNKVGVTRQRRRRRSSVMDLVNAFRRGSLEQNKEKEKELAEQREQRANELLSIHPSVKRPATPDAVTKNLNKDAEDESGGKGWNRARRASFAPEVAADKAWQKLTDPASGRSYWWNPTTQESRWTDPHGMANVVASVAAVAAAARPSQSSLQHDLSQEGDEWVTMKDPSSGQEFYFNRRKNESQWTKPAAMNKNSSTTHSNGEGGSGSSTNSPPAVSSSSSKGDASSASIIAELRAQLLAERNAHAASRAEFRDALDAEREHMKNEMMLAREDNERYLNAIGEESRLQAERESAQIAKLTALMETMVENEQRHEDVLLEKEEQVAALREQV